eukprot:12892280-Prorocentrum_lima.AAC.1
METHTSSNRSTFSASFADSISSSLGCILLQSVYPGQPEGILSRAYTDHDVSNADCDCSRSRQQGHHRILERLS